MDFTGNSFYNSCILVHTILSPTQVLENLQEIEAQMGRNRRKAESYEDRCIDLDLILFDQEIIESAALQVPHPRSYHRNFVLQPLLDISPSLPDPISGKPFKDFMCELEPIQKVVDVELPLSRKRYPLNNYNFIAIEGNIGCGKTSLTHKLAMDFNARKVLERFADNPFLPLFYEDRERYSFPLEMSFLADRYQQLSDGVAQHELFTDFTVADYYVIKSLIFSKITLNPEEYRLYNRLFHMMYKELVKPDIYIYLYQTEERLLENIKKRGRSYEQNIEGKYLNEIQSGYADFIRTQDQLHIKVIDVSQVDFVNSHQDYTRLLDAMLG